MIERASPEANAFWQFDRLERAIQALEYEEEQRRNLEEFFESVRIHDMRDPLLKKLFDEIARQRPRNLPAGRQGKKKAQRV